MRLLAYLSLAILLSILSTNAFADPISGLYVNSLGRVGIGTNTPVGTLDVKGHTNVTGTLKVDNNNSGISTRLTENGLAFDRIGASFIDQAGGGDLFIRTKNGWMKLQNNTSNLQVGGSVYAHGEILCTSDARAKKDIQRLTGSLEKVLALEGVSFSWADNAFELPDGVNDNLDTDSEQQFNRKPHTDNRAHIGVIAQNVEQVFPEAVVTDPETGMKAVAYLSLIGPMIEAIKEQQQQIEDLQTLVLELRRRRR